MAPAGINQLSAALRGVGRRYRLSCKTSVAFAKVVDSIQVLADAILLGEEHSLLKGGAHQGQAAQDSNALSGVGPSNPNVAAFRPRGAATILAESVEVPTGMEDSVEMPVVVGKNVELPVVVEKNVEMPVVVEKNVAGMEGFDLKGVAEEDLAAFRKADMNTEQNFGTLRPSLSDAVVNDNKDRAEKKRAYTSDLGITVEAFADAGANLKSDCFTVGDELKEKFEFEKAVEVQRLERATARVEQLEADAYTVLDRSASVAGDVATTQLLLELKGSLEQLQGDICQVQKFLNIEIADWRTVGLAVTSSFTGLRHLNPRLMKLRFSVMTELCKINCSVGKAVARRPS